MASHIGRDAARWQWGRRATRLASVAFPLAAAVFAVTVWTALFTLAATGHFSRWLPRRRAAPPPQRPSTDPAR